MRPHQIVMPEVAELVTVAGAKVAVINYSPKPLYIRIGPKSISVSDRKPGSYGVGTGCAKKKP
jgi:hypothetical protein